jgi:hypothetical protein
MAESHTKMPDASHEICIRKHPKTGIYPWILLNLSDTMQTTKDAVDEIRVEVFGWYDMQSAFSGTTGLCFSYDSLLLVTRQWLLEYLGCNVLSVMGQAEFREQILRTQVDLVIFCQSVSEEDCSRAAEFQRKHAPGARCVVMFASKYARAPEDACVMLDANCGPAEFLRFIGNMLPVSSRPPAIAV